MPASFSSADGAVRLPALRKEYDLSSAQCHHLAAVDHDGRARDEASGIGGEQEQRPVEIALLAEAAHRDLARHGGALLAREVIAVEVGHDPAGRDGVDADALEGKIEPERLGKLDDARFRYRIGGRALGDAEAEHGGDVDDGAALAGGQHPPCRLLRPEEHRVEIGADDAPPLRFRKLQRASRMRDAGIVDQDGDGAERLLGFVECARHRGAIEDVGPDRYGTPARLFDARLHRREPIGATRHQHHRRTFARQHLGEAHAEPARRAGYERDPAFEIEELCRGHSSLPRRDALRAQRRLPSTSLPARRILHHPPDGTMQVSMAQHDYHEHGSELSETQLRVRALETVLTEKGYIDPAALDLIIEAYETKVGPHTGARIVAKAWRDPAFKRALLDDGSKAVSALGHESRVGDHLVAVENTPTLHNMIVCTLCSCYPWEVLGLPPVWYKSAPYRSRAVKDPRGVLADFGVELPANTEIRVWDSTAETRFLVLPMRPAGTEGWSEERLAQLVTRDAMIGTGLAKRPEEVA